MEYFEIVIRTCMCPARQGLLLQYSCHLSHGHVDCIGHDVTLQPPRTVHTIKGEAREQRIMVALKGRSRRATQADFQAGKSATTLHKALLLKPQACLFTSLGCTRDLVI